MRRRSLLPVLHAAAVAEEAGGALPAVLAVVVVLTLLAGLLMQVYDVQYRFIRRDVHRLQARYRAEAGVYVALDSLQANPRWRPFGPLHLADSSVVEVTVVPFGGYLLVRSVGRARRSRCVLRALVGEVPPAPFSNAVYLWNTESTFNLAGTSRIVGDIVVGEKGLERSDFEGIPFTGEHRGTVHRTYGLDAPYADFALFHESVAFFDTLLARGAPQTPPAAARKAPAWQLPRDNPVYYIAGDARITAADSLLLAWPVTVVAGRDLAVEGPVRFAPGSVFVAGRVLVVEGDVGGREGLFYGREGVDLRGGVRCSGLFFSRAGVRVGAGAYLAYPSVLFTTGEAAEAGGRIEVADSVRIDGTLVHPRLDPQPAQPAGRIVVAKTARVRGSIFNGHETELHGRLDGLLVTFETYFYHSPRHWTNWLKDAVIDRGALPVTYALPVAFSRSPRLVVVSWTAHVDEEDRHAAS